MANAREIQSRIKSVQDTMKITNAMYMISSSKMTQARKKLADTEPYFYGLQGEISRILRHVPEIRHSYFDARQDIPAEQKRIGSIVITADKGLAGAYNHNIIKLEEEILAQPAMHRARDIGWSVIDQFLAGELDEVYVVYTRMENSVQTDAEKLKLLPLEAKDFGSMKMPLNMYREAIELYPSADSVMDSIVPNYVIGMVYGCLVEAYASEHNARMMAMKAATDSAESLIRELSIVYNRARQAAITQEITEVCSGAKAQKQKRK